MRSLRLQVVLIGIVLFAGFALRAAEPSLVVVAGSLQSELGCSDDWQPSCTASKLEFDSDDQVWQKTYTVPAGAWEYKAALNGSWEENYGANAQRNGSNIPLNLATSSSVKFYYDHRTHWVTSNRNAVIATAPGSYQSELGCPGDWQPDCLRSWLQDADGDGTYTMSMVLPAGNYEFKVAIDESWSENYGQGGVQNGANVPFTVSTDCQRMRITYNASTHVMEALPEAGSAPQPSSVTIAGSLQSELGCSGDWQPDCAATHLLYDGTDGVWQGIFNVPAGSFEYKATINDSWDENYGAGAQRNGSNIPLTLASAGAVKFYYDHTTHWITENRNTPIVVAPGSYQHFLGCPGDWQPDCLRSWLQDPDGDGVFTFSTTSLPAGNYEVKIAINESWDENYGAGGVQNGPNISFSVPSSCAETFFSYDKTTHVLTVSTSGAPKGNLAKAQAYWVTADTIAWKIPTGLDVNLHAAANGGLTLTTEGVSGGTATALTYDPAGLPADVLAKFPHLSGSLAFHLPDDADVATILRGQVAVSAADIYGDPVDATSLQIAGVLDDLYSYDGSLGVVWSAGVPTLKLWAPTAKSVVLHRYADSNPSTTATSHAMTRDDATGVWSLTGDSSWKNQFYLYEVNVFVRSTGQVEQNFVTDPYSVSLSKNSARSQIVDLDDPAWKPNGWDTLVKPALAAPEDITLYELHVRDFSASDTSVPADLRGTFEAFTRSTSNGMSHLRALAESGLTHVHLLPAFDIATIDEDKSTWLAPAGDLSSYPPDSSQQQAAVAAVRDQDGFNWGYDPWHYTVPEGSYSTQPDGAQRILEFRRMVQALSASGLRTVMDVVYNHTNAAGQNTKSVLDRIVPGYYHRLNSDGAVETSSCCANTASEHDMMEKLMIDSVLTWVREYKVDGFRFDLMGHHMKRNMTKLRAALDALTPASDGVDGHAVYLYGEGWNFGEVANNARGVNAVQANMAGTGIGTFNDRLRDGARGGGPFSGIQEQGFVSGLFTDPNATDQGSETDQHNRLLLETDWVRAGLVGSLASYTLVDRNGNTVNASQVDYNGQPAGYTADPQEVINYVEAHDNETLFDALQVKLPVVLSMSQRVRAQMVGLSLVALAQGIPFFHAGGEILRSKSMDRNSYNSGDWFNRLDFTYATNNWGVGLPPAGDNQSNWLVYGSLLSDPALKASSTNITDALAVFEEWLAIRRSTTLFRLRTGDDVRSRVELLNAGPEQVPALIVMTIADPTGAIDRQHDLVAVAFNAAGVPRTYSASSLTSAKLALHPIQAASHDLVVRDASFAAGTFTVPGRTTAVFWSIRPLDVQIALLRADVTDKSLQKMLDAAIDAVKRGSMKAAAAQLRTFISTVERYVRTGRMSATSGANLIREANAILALM